MLRTANPSTNGSALDASAERNREVASVQSASTVILPVADREDRRAEVEDLPAVAAVAPVSAIAAASATTPAMSATASSTSAEAASSSTAALFLRPSFIDH